MGGSRRSRLHRSPKGKRLAITRRDIDIFRALMRYRYLRSTYLHAFVGGKSETRFKERLGDLFHEGFIDRPAQQWQFAEARTAPVVYELGAGARRALAEFGECTDESRTFLTTGAHRQFAHSMLICECLASIELATLSRPAIRFIPWCEILARALAQGRVVPVPFRFPVSQGVIVIPDGLFGLEYKTGAKSSYRIFALEVDRGTMPVARSNGRQTSYLAKLAAYRAIIDRELYRALLGVPNLLLLTITTSEVRMADMLQKLGHNGGLHGAFLFKPISIGMRTLVIPHPDFLATPWERVGHAAMSIGVLAQGQSFA